MNRKAPLFVLSALLLTGCGAHTTQVNDESEKLMTIGDTTYTKGDEYTMVKKSNGPALVIQQAQSIIYEKEVPATDEMKKQAQEQFDEIVKANPDSEKQLKTLGYESKDEYIEKVLLPAVQAQELMKKYFTDDQDTIEEQYKPSVAQIIQCKNEDAAKKALQALKDGKSAQEVAEQYMADQATYKGDEALVTTNDTALPTRLINALATAKNPGVMDEVYATDDDEPSYFVAVLVSNNYEENVDRIAETLGSDSSLSKGCLVYYLTKYDFEVHDQDLFDYYKNNSPEYLVTRPDLTETAQETD
ncbi:hypothetical protein [uncultured Dubosiella sp.]|uniref:hypothetical protein n=1 Tax=uncultured Dubosiella sp. TaxID=1937011 RepID=UPI000EDA27E9|nr:hypothetical protein [uncultured Dubosiella sp.]HAM30548.1 hypothetical protein [Erysipelotrichaceae bacterium]